MDLQLRGKRALVTGSSGGIGEGIAKALALEGAVVTVHGLDEADTRRVADNIRAAGGTTFAAVGDLCLDGDAERVASQAVSDMGGVDILINNVGVYKNTTWADGSSAGWAEVFDVNVISATRMIRLLLPQMRERRWGRVLQNGSGEAMQPFPFMPEYAATKAALNNLTVSLAKELAGTGVTVNTISPGIIVTPGTRQFFQHVSQVRGWGADDWPTIEKRVVKEFASNTVGRLGTAEEVGQFFAYLASPLADFINGSNLRIDGGFVDAVM